MEKTFIKTLDSLSGILVKNAQGMMRRVLAAVRQEIADDAGFNNPSYSALLLKVSEPDLLREFEAAIKSRLAAIQTSASDSSMSAGDLSMFMELADARKESSEADFQESAALFDALCVHARRLGITVNLIYRKEMFLASLRDAFSKSRVESAEVEKITPCLRRALNAELVNLYRKLNAI